MKILFEDYKYNANDAEDIVKELLPPLGELKEIRLTQVGYFYNSNIQNADGSKGDLVFILPKVLLDEQQKAFGLTPEDLLNFNYKEWKKDNLTVDGGKLTRQKVYEFIFGFTTWIYRAVDIYRKNQRQKPSDETNEDDIDATVVTSLQVGQSSKFENATLVDILLSLLDFQRTHQSFITFVIKIAHSGYNKIDWSKTISRTQAVIQDDSPIYLNPINKKRVVNFDEELLIIFYSILDYIHEEYGFPLVNQPGYKLIKGAKFNSYLNGIGKSRLHKIRYKYYSDEAILLWNLCYAFFDKTDKLKAQTNRKDYLLINKFETVFEAMVDELIGDKNLPDDLKVGRDDKRIDHLYTYKYLIENLEDDVNPTLSRDIYHIADSKFYGRDKKLVGHDVPKQFTYARNVIQWHMDLLHDIIVGADEYKEIQLFDKVTEGYNIIPNFFFSAMVDEELDYSKPGFRKSTLGDKGKGDNVKESYFFWERLFDRNSFFTLHYDLNFLYILKLYAQNKSFVKETWKREVREEFRKSTLKHLTDTYKFYQIVIPNDTIEEFVEKHYRKLTGKLFSFKDKEGHSVLIYAERKNQKNGNGKSYTFDENSDAYVDGEKYLVVPIKEKKYIYRVQIVNLGKDNYLNTDSICTKTIIVGYYKDEDHLNWIKSNGIYNIPAQPRGRSAKMDDKIFAKYLILHNEHIGTEVYAVTGFSPYRTKKEYLPTGAYMPSHNEYIIFNLDIGQVENNLLNNLVAVNRLKSKILATKSPFALKVESLKSLFEESAPAFSNRMEDEVTFNRMVADEDIDYYKTGE